MDEMFMNELIVKYKVGTCHYIYSNHILNVVWVYDKVFCVAEWTRFEWSRRIQLQFASNRIIIGSLEAEIQPVKCCSTSYAWSMTSRYVIGQLPVTCHFVTIIIWFWLSKHICKTHKLSVTQFPYRRRERRIFVIYSSGCQLCYYPSPVK